MPRNSLTDKEKDFVRRYRIEGGNWLAETLGVDRAAIYQYATDEGFSVKRNGKAIAKHEKAFKRLTKTASRWPKRYSSYKKLLVERDGLRCHYCDYFMTYQDAQVDHVLAKARGGSDAPDNLVLACFRCNNLKSTLCYTCPEFRNKISTPVDK